MTTNEFPEVTTALENDTVLVNASSKSRKITFKNIFEAISFTNLATTAKNIIGAINELKSGHDTMNTKITDNTTGISELNTKIAYEYQYILVGEINIGQAQKFGRIVELDLSNLTVESGTTENDLLFTLASSYAPKNQVDFCDTYGNVRFRIDTAGNAKLTATINKKSFLRGTFMYISAS